MSSCRATNANRRDNTLVTWNGETMCIAAWAERLGVKAPTLSRRLRMWSVERAMTQPYRRSPRAALRGEP